MHWVYGGYVVLAIVAFALISVLNADELARGSGLARGICCYMAVFWGVRLGLQAVFEMRPYLDGLVESGRLCGADGAVRRPDGGLRRRRASTGRLSDHIILPASRHGPRHGS